MDQSELWSAKVQSIKEKENQPASTDFAIVQNTVGVLQTADRNKKRLLQTSSCANDGEVYQVCQRRGGG